VKMTSALARLTLIFGTFFVAHATANPTTYPMPNSAPIRGIKCESMEGQRIHTHQHISIFDHGRPVLVPRYIGFPSTFNCIYWMHTHTADGIIHIESSQVRDFSLGDFFAIWGAPLTRNDVAGAVTRTGEHVAVWVNGERYYNDPNEIDMVEHTDIVIEVGAPYVKPATYTAWNGL
jgi:hypothetical protein